MAAPTRRWISSWQLTPVPAGTFNSDRPLPISPHPNAGPALRPIRHAPPPATPPAYPIATDVVLRNNLGVPKCKVCGENAVLIVKGEPLCIACEEIGLKWEQLRKGAGFDHSGPPKVLRAGAQLSGWPELEQQRRRSR
jgi:hypothetical protein